MWFTQKTKDPEALMNTIILLCQVNLNQLERKWFKTKDEIILIGNIKACIYWTEQRIKQYKVGD